MRMSASLLVLVLLGCSAFSIPKPAPSESINTKSGQRITLLNRRHSGNYDRASLSFRYGLPAYDLLGPERSNRDLLYGALSFNGDRDWFQVAFGSRDRSRIKDLGKMDWSDDIAVPVLPILPCAPNEICNGGIKIPPSSSGKTILDVNPQVAKPIAGHMYVVHTHDREVDLSDRSTFDAESDFYTLFRVEKLKPNESCTITWKRIPSPKD